MKILARFLGLSAVHPKSLDEVFYVWIVFLTYSYCFCLNYMIVDTNIADLGQTAFVEQSDHGLEYLLTSLTGCYIFPERHDKVRYLNN